MDYFDWMELGVITARIAELLRQQEEAEAANHTILASELAAEIVQTESERAAMLDHLFERVTGRAAA